MGEEDDGRSPSAPSGIASSERKRSLASRVPRSRRGACRCRASGAATTSPRALQSASDSGSAETVPADLVRKLIAADEAQRLPVRHQHRGEAAAECLGRGLRDGVDRFLE